MGEVDGFVGGRWVWKVRWLGKEIGLGGHIDVLIIKLPHYFRLLIFV